MRRQQVIQLLTFLFARVLIACFVIFVMEESFIDFLLKYWLYFLIASISYFYYYSIEYETDKKYNVIRNVILYWNVYLFAHVFFRPLLNISHELFVLLWLIILWLWWTTKMRSRWKYLLQALWWVFSFFILISWVFYLYPEEPDIEWFISSKSYDLSFIWVTEQVQKRDAYIQITNNRKNEDFLISPWFSKILSEDCKISYPSLKSQREEKIVIITPSWETFLLFPQSEVSVEFSWFDISRIINVNWRVWVMSWLFDSSLKYIWSTYGLSSWDNEMLLWIKEWYEYELVWYLKNQISDSHISLANNTLMYNIDGIVLKYLAKMFPTSFSKNLDNYNEFQKYFSLVENSTNLSRSSLEERSQEWEFKSFWSGLKKNMKIWKWNTYNIFKMF